MVSVVLFDASCSADASAMPWTPLDAGVFDFTDLRQEVLEYDFERCW